MPISEQGYTHWTGTFVERRLPWWPITRLGIRMAFKRKFFKFAFAISFLPTIIFAAGIYISERLEDFQFMFRGRRGSTTFLEVNPAYFKSYFGGDFLMFMMVMIMVLAGAGLIADDLKSNSLQLYFSRPIRKRDYLLGKMSTLAFFLLLYTLVPGALFILLKFIFAGSFKLVGSYPWIPLAVLLDSIFITFFFTSYTLLISSLSRNRRYTAILLFLVYIFSDVFFGIFYGIFRKPGFCLLSIKVNLQQVAAALFRAKPAFNVPWIYSFLILAGIALACAAVLVRKTRGVEVIR
jgi:ABC-type transport system involved in multi-copper enzyme maturation permease subunit